MSDAPNMLPQRLAVCLQLLGWSNRYFADQIGSTEKMVRLVLDGEQPMFPQRFTDPLEARARHALQHPLPALNPARVEAARQRRAADRRRRQGLAASGAQAAHEIGT